MPKIEYIILDDQETYPDDAVELHRENYAATPRKVAEEAATDYFNNHDGWERSDWPLKFEIYFDGENQGIFEVDQEAIPVFTARKVT